jgi:hypothetical protein
MQELFENNCSYVEKGQMIFLGVLRLLDRVGRSHILTIICFTKINKNNKLEKLQRALVPWGRGMYNCGRGAQRRDTTRITFILPSISSVSLFF